jgi:uncharacterized membrane protein
MGEVAAFLHGKLILVAGVCGVIFAVMFLSVGFYFRLQLSIFLSVLVCQ